jgi:transcriptional regulator with XRE-family HTH domain
MPIAPEPTSTPEPTIAADLLRHARWMVGLTQAEVAQRAGLTRQMISSYESGLRCPSVGTLDRLLSGCGLRLRMSVVPEPGLEDVPTLTLLEQPPMERIAFPFQDAIVAVAAAVPNPRSVIVTGKSAARLRGACVRVLELEVWVPETQPIEEIQAWLPAARMTESYPITPVDLRSGVRLEQGFNHETSVVLRSTAHFTGYLARALTLDVRRGGDPDPLLINIAGPDDCCVGWHPRDRDHLALQRAVRLSAEPASAGALP